VTLALRILLAVLSAGTATCSIIGQRMYFREKRTVGLRRWYHGEHRRKNPGLYYGTLLFAASAIGCVTALGLSR
jgi:hypothetical protein